MKLFLGGAMNFLLKKIVLFIFFCILFFSNKIYGAESPQEIHEFDNHFIETIVESPLPTSVRKLTFNALGNQSLDEVIVVEPEATFLHDADNPQFSPILKTSSLPPKKSSPETLRKSKALISPRKTPAHFLKKPIQTNVKTIIYILSAYYTLFPLLFEITQIIQAYSDHDPSKAKEITTSLSKLMRTLFLFDDTIKRQVSNPIESIALAKECLEEILHTTALIHMKEYAQTRYHQHFRHLVPQGPDEITAFLTTPLTNNIIELIALFTYSILEHTVGKPLSEEFIIKQFEGFFQEAVMETILPEVPPLLEKKKQQPVENQRDQGCCSLV